MRCCVLSGVDGNLNNATFQINSTKLYVPVVTLFINDNKPKNNNLDFMIDPTFSNTNRCLFFHSKMLTMIL